MTCHPEHSEGSCCNDTYHYIALLKVGVYITLPRGLRAALLSERSQIMFVRKIARVALIALTITAAAGCAQVAWLLGGGPVGIVGQLPIATARQATPIPTTAPTVGTTPRPSGSSVGVTATLAPVASPTISKTPRPPLAPTPVPTPIPTTAPTAPTLYVSFGDEGNGVKRWVYRSLSWDTPPIRMGNYLETDNSLQPIKLAFGTIAEMPDHMTYYHQDEGGNVFVLVEKPLRRWGADGYYYSPGAIFVWAGGNWRFVQFIAGEPPEEAVYAREYFREFLQKSFPPGDTGTPLNKQVISVNASALAMTIRTLAGATTSVTLEGIPIMESLVPSHQGPACCAPPSTWRRPHTPIEYYFASRFVEGEGGYAFVDVEPIHGINGGERQDVFLLELFVKKKSSAGPWHSAYKVEFPVNSPPKTAWERFVEYLPVGTSPTGRAEFVFGVKGFIWSVSEDQAFK